MTPTHDEKRVSLTHDELTAAIASIGEKLPMLAMFAKPEQPLFETLLEMALTLANKTLADLPPPITALVTSVNGRTPIEITLRSATLNYKVNIE